MGSVGFEDLEVYRLSEDLADQVWDLVVQWTPFAQRTVGEQLVRSADSVGANIAEGTGRGTYKDNRHFARMGRGSLNETRHFLRRAVKRKLLTTEQIDHLSPVVRELGPRLNAYIRSIGRQAKRSSSTQRPASDQ
jgi:four helix bundle protein